MCIRDSALRRQVARIAGRAGEPDLIARRDRIVVAEHLVLDGAPGERDDDHGGAGDHHRIPIVVTTTVPASRAASRMPASAITPSAQPASTASTPAPP